MFREDPNWNHSIQICRHLVNEKLPKLMDSVSHFLKSGIQFMGLIVPRLDFHGYFTVNATSMVSLKQFSKVCFVSSLLIKGI